MNRTIILAAFVLTMSGFSATAKCAGHAWENPTDTEVRCKIEDTLPFAVRERRIEKDFFAFLDAPQEAKGNMLIQNGIIVGFDGRPIPKAKHKRALSVVIPRATGCKLQSAKEIAGKYLTYVMICPRTPPAL